MAQQPRDIGAKTIEAIVTHFGGGQPQSNIAVPIRIVDAVFADQAGKMRRADEG